MRIQLVSDVHLEFHADRGDAFLYSLDPDGVDVLVVAGDFSTYDEIRNGVGILCGSYPHVVYVAGNHEYYGTAREKLHRELAGLRDRLANFHWLDCDTAEIDGVKFVGAPLWFRDDPSNERYEKYMTDFTVIPGFRDWVYAENERACDFLARYVTTESVVVTHHLPAWGSVSPRFRSSHLNRFFLCDMEELIGAQQPRLWLHGHTHDSCDYRIGGTRVVCNPFGYVGYGLNTAFVDRLIIDV